MWAWALDLFKQQQCESSFAQPCGLHSAAQEKVSHGEPPDSLDGLQLHMRVLYSGTRGSQEWQRGQQCKLHALSMAGGICHALQYCVIMLHNGRFGLSNMAEAWFSACTALLECTDGLCVLGWLDGSNSATFYAFVHIADGVDGCVWYGFSLATTRLNVHWPTSQYGWQLGCNPARCTALQCTLPHELQFPTVVVLPARVCSKATCTVATRIICHCRSVQRLLLHCIIDSMALFTTNRAQSTSNKGCLA
jgi:hypothetical protein